MGLFTKMTDYAHKAELRESKDEIVVGELIRGLAHRGWNCFQIVAHSDRQQLGFKLPGDEVLSKVFVLVDRRTGSGALSAALGSKTTIRFSAEMRHQVSDPDDLAVMWRTDLANLFRIPANGEIRVNHQLGKVSAFTYFAIDLDQYVRGTEVAAGPLVEWTVQQVDQLRETLRPLKK